MTAALGRQLLAGLTGSACPSRPGLAGFPGAAEGWAVARHPGSGEGRQARCQAPDAIG